MDPRSFSLQTTQNKYHVINTKFYAMLALNSMSYKGTLLVASDGLINGTTYRVTTCLNCNLLFVATVNSSSEKKRGAETYETDRVHNNFKTFCLRKEHKMFTKAKKICFVLKLHANCSVISYKTPEIVYY